MPVQAQRGIRIVAVLLLNLGGGWDWWSAPRRGDFKSVKGPRYSWYKRLDGPLSRSERAWRAEKLLPAQGFELRTVHSVGSRYSDYTIVHHYQQNPV
jgi:hypothetical protein